MKWLMTFPEDRASLSFYSAWAARFGAEVVPVSASEPLPASLDDYAGLLLSGGGDVEPSRYGDTVRHEKTYGCNPARDEMEHDLIARFLVGGKPIVGICRGLQILAVHFGGRLHQHVPERIVEDVERHRVPKGYDCFHPVLFDGATQLGAAMRGIPEVNSAHHQAMDESHLPQALRVAARSGQGIVEAVECFDHAAPIVAVQWHPERLAEDHPASEALLIFLRGMTGSR